MSDMIEHNAIIYDNGFSDGYDDGFKHGSKTTQLTLEELRDQFIGLEESTAHKVGYSINCHINEYGEFSDWKVREKFSIWQQCAKANNILREG